MHCARCLRGLSEGSLVSHTGSVQSRTQIFDLAHARRVHLEEAHTWKGRTLQAYRVTGILYSINVVFNSSNNLLTYSKINLVGIT